jgi:hypothetical protein
VRVSRIFPLAIVLGAAVVASDGRTAELSKYGTAFLSSGAGARAEGMGNAFVSIARDATAVYWNPAGLADVGVLEFHGSHSEQFAGVVNADFLGAAAPVGRRSALGFGVYRLGVDDIPITRKTDPNRPSVYVDDWGRIVVNPPVIEKTVNDQELALLFTYAARRSDRFAYGIGLKAIRKSVGDWSAWGLGFDAGVTIRLPGSVSVGLVLKDVTSTWIAWRGGRTETVAPRLRIGASIPWHWRSWSATAAADIENGFSGMGEASQVHAGAYDLEWCGGMEIGYRDRVFLRFGDYRNRLTLGTGFRVSAFLIDYAFTNHAALGTCHRISASFSLDKGRLSRL